jgi:exonuclease I
MTAVEWLIDELTKPQYAQNIPLIIEQAKEIEKQQIIISDEEIEKQAMQIEKGIYRMFFKSGAKWYCEQLKKLNDKTNG